jgi:hypothetical protein
MTQRIIYQNDEGGVAVLIPSPEDLAKWGIEAIALKDVPHGKPYKIVDITDFPLELDTEGNPLLDEDGLVKHDRTFRAAWEVDEATLTDGVGAESNEFPPAEEVTE